jgi:hypothetical protein
MKTREYGAANLFHTAFLFAAWVSIFDERKHWEA